MKICLAEEMRSIDRAAVEKFNIPGIVLMENAAISCVREIEHFDSFCILCGKGNNAGDGLAIARHLINKGKKVTTFLLLGDDFSGDALINYNILKSMGAEVYSIEDSVRLEMALKLSACTVDAIFGTGLHGDIKSPVKEVIELVNDASNYVLSVDIPSGVDADSGKIWGTGLKADKTVTFAAYKQGLLLYPGAEYAGDIVCADISIPKSLLSHIKRNVLTHSYIKEIMPPRNPNSHKGDFGKIFVIGGSVGMAGAPVMSANAAFRSGCGIVTLCVPSEINDIVQKTSVNSMTYPVSFETDTDKIIDKMKGYDAILFGNGIGREDYLLPLLERVMENAEVPVVIDADGLYLLSKKPDMLKKSKCKVILTPHSAEMGRLIGKDATFVEENRISVAESFSKEYGVTLVLKGNHTIITAPEEELYVNITGNSGMATAGSGDVLAGMIASFSAVCENSVKAACLSVFLHGLAGDFAAKKLTETSVTALDIIDAISHILPVENT